MTEHKYNLNISWTGNLGNGTSDYRSYSREHIISIDGKPDILASSDPAFRGDKSKYNPEEMLLASLSSCHLLWYLHLCAVEGIIIIEYFDSPIGIMVEKENGSGKFKEVTLNPVVFVTEEWMIAKANELHKKANEMCFIANSVNFEVKYNPVCEVYK
jgi:organic hydroperoxide reductase OsmC/OhrA